MLLTRSVLKIDLDYLRIVRMSQRMFRRFEIYFGEIRTDRDTFERIFRKEIFSSFWKILKFWYSWIVAKVSLLKISTRTLTQPTFLKKRPLKLIQSASEQAGNELSNTLWFIFIRHIEKILSHFFLRGYLNFYPSWYSVSLKMF